MLNNKIRKNNHHGPHGSESHQHRHAGQESALEQDLCQQISISRENQGNYFINLSYSISGKPHFALKTVE